MAKLTLAIPALVAGLAAHPADAQNSPASNIAPSDTRSLAAPRLPAPPSADATPRQLLADARLALANGRTGAAQEALERAETRLLNRTESPTEPHGQLLQAAQQARQALGRHNAHRADAILQAALEGAAPQTAELAPPQAELAYPPPSEGWRYNGVQWTRSGAAPPEAAPASWIPPHWSWHGAWVWIEGHWH